MKVCNERLAIGFREPTAPIVAIDILDRFRRHAAPIHG
jgi:hypothetical protein